VYGTIKHGRNTAPTKRQFTDIYDSQDPREGSKFGGDVEGYFHEKSLRKSVKSRQNLRFSLEKTENF
jgi:hypothetical protein